MNDGIERSVNARDIRIVLVRPQIPENVGFIARTMNAFGLSRLLLVSPEFEWSVRSPAYKTASGSHDILDVVQITPSLVKAVGDSHTVVGFSRRQSQVERPRIELIPWAEGLAAEPQRQTVSLVFGPENFGLNSQDKRCCDVLVEVPLANPSLSLNLAHAVTVVLYELSRKPYQIERERGVNACETGANPLVSFNERQHVLDRLIDLLDGTNFFKPGRRERQLETMHELLERFGLHEDEYHYVMGLLTALKQQCQK